MSPIYLQIPKQLFDLYTMVKDKYVIWENRKYISLKDAVIKLGEKTKAYYWNGHNEMFEGCKIKQETYYGELLLHKIKEGCLALYGNKTFSSTKKLEQIRKDDILNNIFNLKDYTIHSKLDEVLCTNFFC